MSKFLKTGFSATVEGFYNMTQILPLVISMCVCSAFSMRASIFSVAISSLSYPFTGLLPSYSLFIILYSISAFYGLNTALAGTLICAILLITVSFFNFEKLKTAVYIPVIAGVMLGFTLYMTVMQTTNYFGIGAVGTNAVEMLKSYRSLGFHGNWRGVLYGTIVLVVMIVYRREFKNLSKKIPAAFWSFVITVPLNIFLIPGSIISPINEIGNYDYTPIFFSLNKINAFGSILCGFSLLFIILYKLTVNAKPAEKKDSLLSGAFIFASSLTGSVAPCPTVKKEGNFSSKIISAISSAVFGVLIIIFLKDPIARTPIPTAAVILIIGMWQQNVWKYLKTALTSGITGFIAFISVILIIILVNPETGIIIAAFICCMNKLIIKKTDSFKSTEQH